MSDHVDQTVTCGDINLSDFGLFVLGVRVVTKSIEIPGHWIATRENSSPVSCWNAHAVVALTRLFIGHELRNDMVKQDGSQPLGILQKSVECGTREFCKRLVSRRNPLWNLCGESISEIRL